MLTYPLGFNFPGIDLVFQNFEAQQAIGIMGDIPLDASNIAVSIDISSVMYISSVMKIIHFLNTEINKFDFSVVSSEREVTLRLMKKLKRWVGIKRHIALAENIDMEGEFQRTKFWLRANYLNLLVSVGKNKRFLQNFVKTIRIRNRGYLRNHLFVLQEIKPILQTRYILSAREKTNCFAIYFLY